VTVAGVEENVRYVSQILRHHQDTCGELKVVGEGEDTKVLCRKCGISVVRGDNSAVLRLWGYEIEVV
jgi:hypothetical protein